MVEIPTEKKAKELLSLLEDNLFCVVSHAGLVNSNDFQVVFVEANDKSGKNSGQKRISTIFTNVKTKTKRSLTFKH